MKVSRSERILNELEKRGSISHEGKEWFIAATDPFHDDPVKPTGWPDVETATSVVRCIKQSVTLTKPADVVSSGWDCHIIQWPFLNSQVMLEAKRTNNLITDHGPPLGPLGGCQAFVTGPGLPLDFTTSPTIGAITLDNDYITGISRVIAAGFEVTNTTAEIYKQGLVTSWRQDATRRAPSTFMYKEGEASPPTQTAVSLQLYTSPPTNIADAMLIPGSKQWAAEKGTYAVIGFVGQDNPPEYPNYVLPVIVNGTEKFGVDNEANFLMPSASPFSGDELVSWSAQRLYPFHTSGAVFSGLSNETSLVLTQMVYVETFPTITDKDILCLGTPSAPYDPVALELYSHVWQSLPVAVPVGENPLGEWFADVVSQASDFLAPVAAAMGAGPIAGLIKGGGALAKSYLNTQQKPSPPKVITTPPLHPVTTTSVSAPKKKQRKRK